jgi:hypothetical protein
VGWLIVALAALIDLGSWRKGHHGYRSRRDGVICLVVAAPSLRNPQVIRNAR